MKLKNLYINKIQSRFLFALKFLIGSIILYIFIEFFQKEIYLDIWTFIGPLFGLGLIINGLTGSKIREINYNISDNNLEIVKISVYGSKVKKINISKMKAELKTGDGKKKGLIIKLRLIILDAGKEIEEINSNFLSINNEKIKKLYSKLKDITKVATANG